MKSSKILSSCKGKIFSQYDQASSVELELDVISDHFLYFH